MKSRSRRLRKKSGGAEAPTPVSITETAVTETADQAPAAPNQDASKPWYAAPPPLPPSGPRPGMPFAPGATEETKEPGLFGKLFSSNKQATGTEEPGFFTKLFSSGSSDSSSMFDKMKGLFDNTSTSAKGGKGKSKRKSKRKSKK